MSTSRREGSFWLAVLIMLIGPVVLFFLPFVGAFIAGLVGGRIAGGPGRGALAALFPAFVVAGVGVLVSVVGGAHFGPLAAIGGILAGIGVFIYLLFNSIGLVLGAVIGGAL